MSRQPNILAFDTATDVTHIGLCAAGQQWVQIWPGGAEASKGLIGQCMALLAQAGLTLQNLDAIAFGSGPGSFTGLRTACAVAQGLAYATNKPVIAVPSLAAVAVDAWLRLDQSQSVLQLCAAMDARMGEAYVEYYEISSNKVNEIGDRMAILPKNLLLNDAKHLAGNAHRAYPQQLPAEALAVAVDAAPTGAALLHMAQQQWRDGKLLDAAMAHPAYVRNKVALTEAERELAKQAAKQTAKQTAQQPAGAAA